MSQLIHLVTFVIDLLFGWAFDKTEKQHPLLAWIWPVVGLILSLTAIVLFYRYFG